MAFFNEFPHARTYDSDLGWLIWAMKKLIGDWEDFSNTNAIKFADPITWTIDRNYEPTTIVIDDEGNGYISRRAVPAGVPLNNADYWTEIFAFGDITNKIRENIAIPNFEESATATEALTRGALLWWNNTLYEAMTDIPIGTALLPDENINQIVLDDWILSKFAATAEDIDDLNTALTTLGTNVTEQINNIIAEITDIQNEFVYINVKDHGAAGDGVTDDTAAIQAAFDESYENKKKIIVFPAGTYVITSQLIYNHSNAHILGYGAIITKPNYLDDFTMLGIRPDSADIKNITIEGLEFDGKKPAGIGTFITTATSSIAIVSGDTYNISNITVRNCHIHDNISRGISLDGGTTSGAPRAANIVIENCTISNIRKGISQSIVSSIITKCSIRESHLENITVDNGCLNCIIDSNFLGMHYGGAGNISLDESTNCIITNNMIDGEDYESTNITLQCGIIFNAQSGTSKDTIIANNKIYNNKNHGIRCRYTSLIPVNGLIIHGNIFENNAVKDIIFENAGGIVKLTANAYSMTSPVDIAGNANKCIKESDTPILLLSSTEISSMLKNGWVLQDANLSKIMRLGSDTIISLSVNRSNATASGIMDIPDFTNIKTPVYISSSSIDSPLLTTAGELRLSTTGTPDVVTLSGRV